MKPGRLFAAVGAVIIAIVAAPILQEVYADAHPDPGTRYGRAFENCVEDGVSRWSRDDMRLCMAMARASREY